MLKSMTADIVVLLHFAFILFVILGGLPAFRWPRIMWLHLPSAFWGAMVELADWFCPLTHLENALRRGAGGAYSSGFIEHYIMPVMYPAGLTTDMRIVLGSGVVVVNSAIYGLLFWKRRRTGNAKQRGT